MCRILGASTFHGSSLRVVLRYTEPFAFVQRVPGPGTNSISWLHLLNGKLLGWLISDDPWINGYSVWDPPFRGSLARVRILLHVSKLTWLLSCMD